MAMNHLDDMNLLNKSTGPTETFESLLERTRAYDWMFRSSYLAIVADKYCRACLPWQREAMVARAREVMESDLHVLPKCWAASMLVRLGCEEPADLTFLCDAVSEVASDAQNQSRNGLLSVDNGSVFEGVAKAFLSLPCIPEGPLRVLCECVMLRMCGNELDRSIVVGHFLRSRLSDEQREYVMQRVQASGVKQLVDAAESALKPGAMPKR